ncbi:nuclear transport factor 2 family protein [Herbidospora daliensis]|uniref:nuclear transport factor 2 family protein n=1 Tax=Herbidospora daliensis TaxID=295585 RepID=UPI0007821C82|nr:nuclear transport factor 2 family protein [Herbidospora daliensis]
MTTAPNVDTLQRLLDIEQIKQLKARYFRFHDTKQWDEFAKVFAPDVQIEIDGNVLRDSAAMVSAASAWVAEAVTVHRAFMPEIEITGSDSATGIWSMADYLVWPDKDGLPQGMRGYGYYHEEYRKIGGEWLISRLRLDRLKVELFEGGVPAVG